MQTKVTYTQTATGALDDAFENTLRRLRSSGGIEMANLLAGERRQAGLKVERRDPSQLDVRASVTMTANVELVAEAVACARAAQPEWQALDPCERCARIRAAIPPIAERQVELAAMISMEIGKARHETIAEIQEAIELIETYTAQVESQDGFSTTGRSLLPDELSTYVLRPYGVFAVIVPFNFPCALAINMSVAALLMGNAVVVKPPEDSPASCGRIVELLAEQVPPGLVNVVHGDEAVGRSLIGADIDGVAFTGSVEVGLAIERHMRGGDYPRPVIAEMGGSNPTIVTSSADLDTAAEAITRAAFGIAGQKCTACSRVIALEGVYDELVRRLADSVSVLRVGNPADRDTFVGPLINERATERYRHARRLAEQDGLVVAGSVPDGLAGHFVEPLLVTELPPGHDLTREEFFVPILTVTAAKSLDSALTEANAVRYGLAAGLFAGDKAEIATFLERIEAGVVYVNHRTGATTGAWPGAQSMCGWKASGTTGRGGLGPHYVPQFGREQSRTVRLSAAIG